MTAPLLELQAADTMADQLRHRRGQLAERDQLQATKNDLIRWDQALQTVRKRIRELREGVPGMAIRTTFIVGYPGEREEDHQELLAFVKEAKFERLGAFIFSREEGTPSYELPDQVPEEVKERRYNELMFVQREVSRELNEALMGSEVEVMIERVSEESELVVVGRVAQQAPDIDGLTYVGLDDELSAGRIVKAVVTQVTDYDLAVELLRDEEGSPIFV